MNPLLALFLYLVPGAFVVVLAHKGVWVRSRVLRSSLCSECVRHVLIFRGERGADIYSP